MAPARKLREGPPPATDLILRWDEKERPLPVREIRAATPGLPCPDWL